MKRKLEELELNESVKYNDVITSIEPKIGENMWFVGKSFTFVGDNEIIHTDKTWVEGFKPDNYDQEGCIRSKVPMILASFASICAIISIILFSLIAFGIY